MAFHFLDSSALVKRYLEERGTRAVLDICASSDGLVASGLSWIEVTSAVSRRARGGDISHELAGNVINSLEEDFQSLLGMIEMSTPVLAKSRFLARSYALRAADSIQLACALVAVSIRERRDDLVFVSADVELNAAAKTEQLIILDPNEVDS